MWTGLAFHGMVKDEVSILGSVGGAANTPREVGRVVDQTYIKRKGKLLLEMSLDDFISPLLPDAVLSPRLHPLTSPEALLYLRAFTETTSALESTRWNRTLSRSPEIFVSNVST